VDDFLGLQQIRSKQKRQMALAKEMKSKKNTFPIYKKCFYKSRSYYP